MMYNVLVKSIFVWSRNMGIGRKREIGSFTSQVHWMDTRFRKMHTKIYSFGRNKDRSD